MSEGLRPGGRRREGLTGLAVGFVLALALHALIVPALGVFARLRGEGAARRLGAQVVTLAKEQAKKNRRIQLDVREAPMPSLEKKERKKEEDDEAEAPGQVVALPPPEKQQKPKVADYASEWEQSTDHETRSRDQRQVAPSITRQLQQGAPGATADLRAAQPRTAAPLGSVTQGPVGPGRSSTGDSGADTSDGRGQRMFALEIPRQAAREQLKLRVDADGTLKNHEAVPEIPGNGETARISVGAAPMDLARKAGNSGDETGQGLRGGGDGTAGLPSLEQLTPSPSQLARLSGAPMNDYLPEVEVDAETRLNAWRWKHATFFNRIADAIRREWQGGQVLAKDDPAGHVYGFEDRMTVLQVTLDRGGNVVDVNVAEPSGAVVLDDEAVRAFKEAGPFANPPSQLFKGNERFTFLFGFNVSYNRTNFDLDWRPD
jgi:TonB family protein